MALLVYGLINAATHSWGASTTIGTLAAAAVLLVSFVIIESRSSHALMPLKIFANRDRSAAYLVMLLIAAALFAMFYFLTQYLQNVKGYSTIRTGLAFLPLSVLIGVGAQVASMVVGRIGVRPLLLVGTAASTGGLAWLPDRRVHQLPRPHRPARDPRRRHGPGLRAADADRCSRSDRQRVRPCLGPAQQRSAGGRCSFRPAGSWGRPWR